jgi:spermidine/putrescine transport system permease protein
VSVGDIAMTPRIARTLLAGPTVIWLVLLLVVPCALLLVNSFFERGTYGGIVYNLTLDNYARAFDPLYLDIFLSSARIAATAAIIALLIGYPAAYAIARAPEGRQAAYLVLVMLPFWSNYLIRTYAWMVMLNPKGIINNSLAAIGLPTLPLLYNEFAVILGLVYNYTPFVVLAIFASLARVNREVLEASADLGASGLDTFRRVLLPLTIGGIATGFVFVFVLSIGNFITPALLGGKRVQMIGTLVYDQFLSARDWPFGSALASVLVAIMLLLMFGQALLTRRIETSGERPVATVKIPVPGHA